MVIPSFNESARIARVVAEVRLQAPELDVLVVDDCSKDSTSLMASKAGAIVVRHPINLGDGAARQTGFKFAYENGYRRVITLDGDGQHDPKSIPALLALVDRDESDLVIGSRFLDHGSSTPYKAAWGRRLGMLFFATLTSALIGQRVTDTTSGFRALNHRAIRLFAETWFPQTFPDSDLLLFAHRAGLRIREVPAIFHEDLDGPSIHQGITPVYYVFKMCLSLFVTLLRRRPSAEKEDAHGPQA